MKNLVMSLGLIFSVLAIMTACSAVKVKPGAERVLVSKNPPPAGCKFMGTVVGSQGNSFTGGWTSNKNLSEGAMNDMKNKALNLGANYVQIETESSRPNFVWRWFYRYGQHIWPSNRCDNDRQLL